MLLALVIQVLCLCCSGVFAGSSDTVETAVNQNCGVYFRNPETKAFIKMGSMEDLLCLAPINDFISSEYVTMFSNERLLGQSPSHNLVELSILAQNATVGNAIIALRGFLYDLPDVLYGVSFFCDAKGTVSVWRIFTSEEFASRIVARILLVASQHPGSKVQLKYVEKKPFAFELETVESPYWNLFSRTSDDIKLLSSFSRTGIESLVDNLTRFDSLDYSSFIVAKNDECFEKFRDSFPKLRLTIPNGLVRSFLCWPIVEDRNDGAVYDVPKNHGLEYLYGISFDVATEKFCFVDYFISLDAPDQAINSIQEFVTNLDAHQRWKTLLIGTKPYELNINLRCSLTGRPVVLSHAPGGLSLMGAWKKGLLPGDPDKSTFVFEFPAAAPSGTKQVGFTVEVPASSHLKKLLLISTYYDLCNSLFAGFKEFLWKIVIRQVGQDKMQLIWIFSTKTSPGRVVGLESKQIASVMAKFMTFNGARNFTISEVVMNGSNLKSDRQAKPAIHDCSEVMAVFEENFEPRLILPESFATPFVGSEQLGTAEENTTLPLVIQEVIADIPAEIAIAGVVSLVQEQEQVNQVLDQNMELYYIMQHGFAGFQLERPRPDGDRTFEIRFNLQIDEPSLRAEILHRILAGITEIYLLKAGPITQSSAIQVFLALKDVTLQEASVFKMRLKSQDSRITDVRLFSRR